MVGDREMSFKLLFILLQAIHIVSTLPAERIPSEVKSTIPSVNNQTSRQNSNGLGDKPRIISAISEPGPEIEPKPENEPEPKNEPEPGVEGEPGKAEDWPEPGPRWKEAYHKWGVAWEIHNYGFSACFFFVFVYSSYYVVVNIKDAIGKKYLSISLNVMMVVCGFTRFFILVLDPYHQGTAVDTPIKLMRIFWSLTGPCLTAADSLVILSLLETYKLSIAPQRFQKPSTIFPIIIIHFSCVLISDLVVSEFVEAKGMLLFCQVFFITWCATLGVGYFLIGYKLDKLIFQSNDGGSKLSQEGRWYIYLIYASGISNLITSSVYIYSAAGVFGIYSDVEFVDAWSWWNLQTALRITELIAAVLVLTVSAKRAQPTHEPEPSDESDFPPSGSATFAAVTMATSSEPAAKRKRKMSMFSGLRNKRDNQYSSENEPSDMTGTGGHNFSVAHCKVGVDNEDSSTNVTQTQGTQLEKKNSMFTALAKRAEKAKCEPK